MTEIKTFSPNYTYYVTFVRAIDGDTYVFRADLGFRASITLEVRLRGADTPELRNATTMQAGNEATHYAHKLLTEAREIVIVSHRDRRSFTRWIADVYVDGSSLADLLVFAGHATRV